MESEKRDLQVANDRKIEAIKQRNETYEVDSVDAIIKLNSVTDNHNACYNNDEIFATFFCDKNLFQSDCYNSPEEDYSDFQEDNGLKIKDVSVLVDSNSINFDKVLASGNIEIYSKIEGKFIDEIVRVNVGFSWQGSYKVGPFAYYLPKGPIFFAESHFCQVHYAGE